MTSYNLTGALSSWGGFLHPSQVETRLGQVQEREAGRMRSLENLPLGVKQIRDV